MLLTLFVNINILISIHYERDNHHKRR